MTGLDGEVKEFLDSACRELEQRLETDRKHGDEDKKALEARMEGVVMRACTSDGGGSDNGEVDPKKGVVKDMGVERQEGERGVRRMMVCGSDNKIVIFVGVRNVRGVGSRLAKRCGDGNEEQHKGKGDDDAKLKHTIEVMVAKGVKGKVGERIQTIQEATRCKAVEQMRSQMLNMHRLSVVTARDTSS